MAAAGTGIEISSVVTLDVEVASGGGSGFEIAALGSVAVACARARRWPVSAIASAFASVRVSFAVLRDAIEVSSILSF